eukprot:CAMPEP_0182530906 /NCGR_PEP_ID=MMETSP1323-20130603/7258_1 /TAXON_ID=236787 /ORGANISM="Florenciella parvula, Strain RCC1693" /LENGTH=46 /DNA_ID= /DNA_START= /DNA_END= /DNA_ORIENTATION=
MYAPEYAPEATSAASRALLVLQDGGPAAGRRWQPGLSGKAGGASSW